MPTLAEKTWQILERLGDGWKTYLRDAGLDLSRTTLETLAADLTGKIDIDFDLPGLEDFCRAARRGIEPGDPAKSLLYHALASPSVTLGIPNGLYPSPYELDILENFVFSLAKVSVADLRLRAPDGTLAIVVFAYEYSPAIDTVHRRHADMCFSRTGISRIGNVEARYVPAARGFLPNDDSDLTRVHVVPCRYGAFVAIQRKGDRSTIGPERFQPGDESTDFWVPVHKLFNGPECLEGLDLRVSIEQHHVNEKIRRTWLALSGYPWSGDMTFPPSLDKPPYRISEELAVLGNLYAQQSETDGDNWDFRTAADSGEPASLLMPIPGKLVDFAMADRQYVTFTVPPHFAAYANSMLWLHDQRTARRSPELLYAKYALIDGKPVYLPDHSEPFAEAIAAGGYEAIHMVDRTADGWIEAKCDELMLDIPQRLSAYSVIAPPDFYPLVKQQDIAEWWENSAPADLKNNIWPESDTGPDPLSSARLPPNLTLTGAHFDANDTTCTAIVGFDRPATPASRIRPTRAMRESTLSYRASNVFQPGWDTSQDYFFNADSRVFSGPMYLANYGLSSPFALDAMICAIDGAFWPGAAPDTKRTFGRGPYPTVTPVPDSAAGWDGLPAAYREDDKVFARSLASADYVKSVKDGTFRYGVFAGTDFEEYIRVTLTMARVYQVLKATDTAKRAEWVVLSFMPVTADEAHGEIDQTGIASSFQGRAYRFEMVRTDKSQAASGKPNFTEAQILREALLIATPAWVFEREKNGKWKATEF